MRPANSAPGQQRQRKISKNGVKLVVNENQIMGAVNHVKVKLQDVFQRLSKVEAEANANKKYIEHQKNAAQAELKQRQKHNYNKDRFDLIILNTTNKLKTKYDNDPEKLLSETKKAFKRHLDKVYVQYQRAGLMKTGDTKESIVGKYDEEGNYDADCLLGRLFKDIIDFQSLYNAVRNGFDDELRVDPDDETLKQKTKKHVLTDPETGDKWDPLKIFYNVLSLMASFYVYMTEERGMFTYGLYEVDETVDKPHPMDKLIKPNEDRKEGEIGDGNGEESGGGEGQEGAEEESQPEQQPDETSEPQEGVEGTVDNSRFMSSQLRQLQARLSQL